jgi:hypothetical protein
VISENQEKEKYAQPTNNQQDKKASSLCKILLWISLSFNLLGLLTIILIGAVIVAAAPGGGETKGKDYQVTQIREMLVDGGDGLIFDSGFEIVGNTVAVGLLNLRRGVNNGDANVTSCAVDVEDFRAHKILYTEELFTHRNGNVNLINFSLRTNINCAVALHVRER